ncbi:serine/arginine-rich splicing factor 2-like isoform X2 [Oppia nitens]|uniref:serine/arginine-rich splicing factor 2-like isoform X2 n=1 Tax=Oppia nitens TaxID=1686743 RepID=UPI0023DAF0B8|nr:serine/arginine-rich splicing factor 2-like isoform X2 [Oppia nitens]
MSSSPSSRRNRSTDESSTRKSRHDNYDHYTDRDRDDEFNTRGHGPPKIEGMVSLKVDNITQRTGVNLLKKVFGKFGNLGDIYVPRYPDTFASRGFAFVRYYRKRDAEDAMRAMNGERLDGRILSIQMARYARPNSKTDKYLSANRSHYSSDDRRNGFSRSYRRPAYSDRLSSRRRRSRSRSRSRSRKTDSRHKRSRSGSKSRSSKRRRSPSRDRSKSQTPSKSRSKSKSRSRSRSQNRSSSEKIEDEVNNDVENECNLNDNNDVNYESENDRKSISSSGDRQDNNQLNDY